MAELRYSSSRGGAPAVTLSEAIRQGLAPDGGLYVPTRLPEVDVGAAARSMRLPDIAQSALGGFFRGDPLEPRLADIAQAAFDFPAPTTAVEKCPDPLFVLELFHGPTAAFKDFGARFLAETLARTQSPSAPPMTILVATSGDTGGAVAAAFHRRPWARIVILYPEGAGERPAGATAHLLGGQRARPAHRRHLRRLPASGEGGIRRSLLERAASFQLREQHQHRPSAAANGLLRGLESRCRAAYGQERLAT